MYNYIEQYFELVICKLAQKLLRYEGRDLDQRTGGMFQKEFEMLVVKSSIRYEMSVWELQ